jgi:hypothetical protein
MDAGFSLTKEERVALTFIAHNDPKDGFVRRTWLEFKTAICGLLQRTRSGGWIPAGERLPVEGQEVLAWNGGGQCEKPWQGHVLCEYRNGEWRESQEFDRYPGVTHWMPLPEPPG